MSALHSFPAETQKESAKAFKLVDAKTGEEVSLPFHGKCWDGHEITVRGFAPSWDHGRIFTTAEEVFVPSVVGLKIVPADVSAIARAGEL